MGSFTRVAFGLAALSAVVDAGSAGARTAQVIVMTGPQVDPDEEQARVREAEFRLNSLRRYFEMAGVNLGYADVGEDAVDPFAAQDIASMAGASSAPFARSAIVVPLWMQPRSGVVQSAPLSSGACGSVYAPSGLLSVEAEARRRSYYDLMAQIACEHDVPVGLFDAMIIAESRYNASAISPKAAYGLTQLMPDTAVSLGVNRFDITGNLRGGARYLRTQIDRFGQYHLALAAYNAGPGRVRNGRIPEISETQAYVGRIMRDWNSLARRAPVQPVHLSARRTERSAAIISY